MANIAILFVYLIVMVFLMAIPIIIGVYVYRDAKRRGMNAILWAMVAVFAPSLIGFIIYLIVRENYSDLACPQCGTKVKEQYVICPNCGAKLQPACDNCGTVVEPEWKLCPTCTQPLNGDYSNVVMPQKTKDKTLGKILMLVILIPIILIGVMFVSMILFASVRTSGTSGASGSLTQVDYDEFYENVDNTEIKKYLESAKSNNQGLVIEYSEGYSDDEEDQYYYLIYVPGAGELDNLSMFIEETGWFGSEDTFVISLEDTKGTDEYIYCMVSGHEETDDITLYFNSLKQNTEYVKVNYNPIENYAKNGELKEWEVD